MIKNEINQIIKDYARHNLSPREPERKRVSNEYERLSSFLKNRVFQNGSYARYTSTTPVNDLDIIYVLPKEVQERFAKADIDPSKLDINNILETLVAELAKEYTEATIKIQPHSVGIYFGNEDDFSIDVVPAMPRADGKFWVPEAAHMTIRRRREFYGTLKPDGGVHWIKSDPKGYKDQAKVVDNRSGGDFRKTAKYIRKWKRGCKELNNDFPLKSFHLELIVTQYFKEQPSLTCLDVIETFYKELQGNIQAPQFPDLADSSRYVDEYLTRLSIHDKDLVERMCNRAQETVVEILEADRESDVLQLIDKLLLIKITTNSFESAPAIIKTAPAFSRPYCEAPWKLPNKTGL